MFGFQLSLFYCFGFWIPIVNFLVFVCFAFWIPIVNFLILLHFAFWTRIANFLCFGFQFTSIQTLALSGYEADMPYSLFIGNLKAGTSCLGAKCCPLIGHLDTADSCYGRGEARASPKLHCGRMRKWRTHALESGHSGLYVVA